MIFWIFCFTFPIAFLFNTGHGTGYGFEIINTLNLNAAKKNSNAALEYLMYAKRGAGIGYGSWIALIPEFKFGTCIWPDDDWLSSLYTELMEGPSVIDFYLRCLYS